MNEGFEEHERLIRMIRQICREEIGEALSEHLDDYEHKGKPASQESALLRKEK